MLTRGCEGFFYSLSEKKQPSTMVSVMRTVVHHRNDVNITNPHIPTLSVVNISVS